MTLESREIGRRGWISQYLPRLDGARIQSIHLELMVLHPARIAFLAQMGESFEEVVTGAESLKPVLLLKAVVNSVTFRLTGIFITIVITSIVIIEQLTSC